MARRPQSAFSFTFPRLMPGVRALLIALAVISIGIDALSAWISPGLGAALQDQVILHPGDLWRGRVWELFTFTLFEPAPLGLLLNGLMLWMFGTQLEQTWGTRRFLFFYFSTTALAGVAAALLGLVVHPIALAPNHGGWTSIEALSAGFALSFPSAQILLAFVVPIQARLLIPISLALTLVYVLMTGQWVLSVVPLLALGAAVLLHSARGPEQLWLRLRVRWIERKMRRGAGRLRVVPGIPSDDELPARRSGSRGSDGFLH